MIKKTLELFKINDYLNYYNNINVNHSNTVTYVTLNSCPIHP